MKTTAYNFYDPGNWLAELTENVADFLRQSQDLQQPGRYLPCQEGLTQAGRNLTLGPACFAVKTLYTIGRWGQLDTKTRLAHTNLIVSYQTPDGAGQGWGRGAFADPTVMQWLRSKHRWHKRVVSRLKGDRSLSPIDRAYLAETKQAIVTLAQVGVEPPATYTALPRTAAALDDFLGRLDWRFPWAAGGQFSCVATLLAHGAKRDPSLVDLVARCIRQAESLVDPLTGAYFAGPRPDQPELINGAMKILTALHWCGEPVHHPERLIDTCLRKSPETSGCHLVDAVYVLYQCGTQTDHRRDERRAFCERILDRIQRHYGRDGGFSNEVDRSQTNYYGVRIAEGRNASDLHSTCLLTWALAMLSELLELGLPWEIITP